MQKTTVVTTGLLCLGLLLPRAAHAQAEELPPATIGIEPRAPETPTRALAPAAPVSPRQTTDLAPTSATPNYQHGIVFAPYLGFNLPLGTASEHYSAGLRLGALLGWHVTPGLSVNGECSLDFMNADSDSSYWSSFWRPREFYVDATISPLVHIRSSQIVVGPKLGWFSNARSSPILTWNGQGFLFGINAGLFMPIRNVMVGGLLSAVMREFTSFSCVDHNPEALENCGYHANPTTTVGLTGAVLF
jgi:hypothetical protein